MTNAFDTLRDLVRAKQTNERDVNTEVAEACIDILEELAVNLGRIAMALEGIERQVGPGDGPA